MRYRGWTTAMIRGSVALWLALASACSSSSESVSYQHQYTMVFAVTVHSKTAASTITRAQLFVDGAMSDDQSFSPAEEEVAFGGAFSGDPGSHTFSVKMAGQTVSSVVYTIEASVYVTDNTTQATQDIEIGAADHTIATGSSATLTFNVH
jgi:hypothetical protein